MNDKTSHRHINIDFLTEAIDKREIQLFNAFSLAKTHLFVKDPPFDYEFLSNLTNEFRMYKEELEAMGKHPFYTG